MEVETSSASCYTNTRASAAGDFFHKIRLLFVFKSKTRDSCVSSVHILYLFLTIIFRRVFSFNRYWQVSSLIWLRFDVASWHLRRLRLAMEISQKSKLLKLHLRFHHVFIYVFTMFSSTFLKLYLFFLGGKTMIVFQSLWRTCPFWWGKHHCVR